MLIDKLYLNVGAMKAGTTWLYTVLSRHPDIHFSLEKEVHYFAHTDLGMNPLGYRQRLQRTQDTVARARPGQTPFREMRQQLLWSARYVSEPVDDLWYTGLFEPKPGQWCADFSNLHCHLDAKGWAHVRRVAGQVKAVYIMRNPLERIWSHAKFHAKIVGVSDQLPSWSPEEMQAFCEKSNVLLNGEYSRVVGLLRDNLQEDELRIAFFDDIHEDPMKWLRELERFLGVSAHVYDEKALREPVNTTESRPMPERFAQHLAPIAALEADGLSQLGFTLPPNWR